MPLTRVFEGLEHFLVGVLHEPVVDTSNEWRNESNASLGTRYGLQGKQQDANYDVRWSFHDVIKLQITHIIHILI